MFPLTRLAQQERRAPTHHVQPMIDEVANRFMQRQLARLTIHDRQENHGEAFLHLRVLVQLVQHNLRLGASLQLDHDPHAIAIALVTHIRNLVNDLFVHQLRDALDQRVLVDLVRNLGNDNCFASTRNLLGRRTRPHQEASPPRAIGLRNIRAPIQEAARRKIRTLHMLQHFFQTSQRIVDQRDRRIDHFRQIMRRNIRRHSNRNPIRPIHNQVWNTRRKSRRLKRGLVVIRHKIDRIHVDVSQHLAGYLHHAAFGIPHCRRRIAIDRTKIALPINHRITQTERLRQPHHGVVNRRVAMRMKHTHRLPHDLGALGVLLVELQPHLVHRVQHASMHRLEAIANIRQCAANNHRHRVVEIRPPHLVFNVDRNHVGGTGTRRSGRAIATRSQR